MIKMAQYSDELAEQIYVLATAKAAGNSIWENLGYDSAEALKAVLKNAPAIFLLPTAAAWMGSMTVQTADFHFLTWGHEIFGELEEMKAGLDVLHETTGIGRVWTQVPAGHRVLKKIVEQLGFVFEGTNRKIWRLRDGSNIDAEMWALVY
jgi:hypothetical protein